MPVRLEDLAGTWRLIRASAIRRDGEIVDKPFGAEPNGLLLYSTDGTMAALISHGGRRRLSRDRIAATVDEQAEAFATFFAYGGRYSLVEERLIHHVLVASVENWVGTDLVRTVQLHADRLTLRTPPLLVGGETRVTELLWERVRDGDRARG